jgi:hypothetical protein
VLLTISSNSVKNPNTYGMRVKGCKICVVMLCYVMLCYVMLRYVMLCYVMLLCSVVVMLCYVSFPSASPVQGTFDPIATREAMLRSYAANV